jgi:glycosyltransferase involved in cell wall biosynthesis
MWNILYSSVIINHMQLSKKSNVLILSHFYTRAIGGGGPPQELRNYLLHKINTLVYIEHPFPRSDDKRSSMSIYKNGLLKEQVFTPPRKGYEGLFYLADFWINIYFIVKSKTTFDVCIALDCLNALNMIPFRFLRIAKKLIFYTIDYIPKRFSNTLLNKLYHASDRFACRYADAIWNLSPKMPELRRANGVRHMAPSVTLPMGANLERIRPLPISKIHRHQLIFVGVLWEKQGLQLVIQALPEIIKKVKNVRLVVIGKGGYEQTLKKLTHSFHIEKHVKFLGFVEKHTVVEKVLCKSAIGIAPYIPTPDNFTYFTDPGKPKLYLACGLPVVTTDVPAIARVIHSHQAGMIIDYTITSAQEKLLKLLMDDKLYSKCRKNAILLSKRYNTNSLIMHALEKT